MATVKKMKKAQDGADMVSKIKEANKNSKSTARKTGMNFDKKSFDSVKSYDSSSKLSNNPLFEKASKMKDTTRYKKAKSGGSFPDLNKDGKVTKADILKGRGVIAKSGTKMKMGGAAAKQAAIAIAMKKAGKTPKKK